eukprot:GHVH01006721.1.p1 GENE.GHVH01006721.1~~GHVH01006721.1.p1  ORF type:complete len:580 (-),score=47.99 GHVH01006721.1:947-2686(-)
MSYVLSSSTSDSLTKSPRESNDINKIIKEYPRSNRLPFRLVLLITAVFLAGACNGWTLGGVGGTFTMDSFRQDIGWDVDCSINPNNINCDIILSEPTRIIWDDPSIPCYDCCCLENTERSIKSEQSQISSFASWGAACGAIFTSFLSEWLGRKTSIQVACCVMIVGSALQFFSWNVTSIIWGRWISGMSMGCLLPLGPMILSEVAPVRIRGILGSGGQMALVTGQFIASVANIWLPSCRLGWRFSLGTPAILAAISAICLIWCPESPRWLYMKGRTDELHKVMNSIRDSSEEIEEELKAFSRVAANVKVVPVWHVFKPYHRWKTLTTFCLHTFQQFSGILVTTNFCPQMYSIFFGSEIASYSFVIFNVVRMVVLIGGIALSERMGRLKQLFVGGIIMTIGQLAIALSAIPYNLNGIPNSDYPDGTPPYMNHKSLGILIIIMSYVYVAGYSIAWGNLPLVCSAEYLRNDVRGHGMGLGSVVVWVTGALTTTTYPYMSSSDSMDLYGTYLYYTFWTALATFFVAFCMMETRGIPIEDVQDRLDEFKKTYQFRVQKDQLVRRKCTTVVGEILTDSSDDPVEV